MGGAHRIAASLLVVAGTGACRSVFGLDDPLPGDPGGPIDAPGTDTPVDNPPPVCTAANLTCNGTKIAFQCGSRCWVGCDEPVSHSTAVNRCNGGFDLTPFFSMNDVSCFRDHIQPTGDSWIGLVQMTGAALPADNWSWNGSGFTPPFFNWSTTPTTQPDDGDGTENGTEQCAQILDVTDKWQDVPCNTMLPFACRGDD